MSTFTVVIHGAPYTSQAALSALHFCNAVIACGQQIHRLFFYQDGVYNASALIVPPQDELHLPQAWQQLIAAHDIDAIVCVASALKRGVLSEQEASRYDKAAANLLAGFSIGGLGQLVDATLNSDCIVNFAP
jgi:tRNA 2-thiouridine synthesizing protein D